MSELPQIPVNQQTRKRSPLVIVAVLAAVVVLGCAAWYAWGYFAAKGAVDAVKQATGQSDAGANSPTAVGKTTIDINVATPDQFYSDANFTDEQRVDWAWNKINQPSHEVGYEGMTLLEAAHKKLADSINNKPQYGNAEFLHELVTPSESMSGDQIQTYISSVSYLAATADLSDSDRVKILAAASDNSSPNLQKAISSALSRDVQHMSGTSEVQSYYVGDTRTKSESPVFRHYKTSVYDPAGIPSKVMNTIETSTSSPRADQMIIHFIDGKPTIVDAYPENSTTKHISNPDKIPQDS